METIILEDGERAQKSPASTNEGGRSSESFRKKSVDTSSGQKARGECGGSIPVKDFVKLHVKLHMARTKAPSPNTHRGYVTRLNGAYSGQLYTALLSSHPLLHERMQARCCQMLGYFKKPYKARFLCKISFNKCVQLYIFLMFKCHVVKDLSIGEIYSQISNFFCPPLWSP